MDCAGFWLPEWQGRGYPERIPTAAGHWLQGLPHGMRECLVCMPSRWRAALRRARTGTRPPRGRELELPSSPMSPWLNIQIPIQVPWRGRGGGDYFTNLYKATSLPQDLGRPGETPHSRTLQSFLRPPSSGPETPRRAAPPLRFSPCRPGADPPQQRGCCPLPRPRWAGGAHLGAAGGGSAGAAPRSGLARCPLTAAAAPLRGGLGAMSSGAAGAAV